jgi:hypothetical protein
MFYTFDLQNLTVVRFLEKDWDREIWNPSRLTCLHQVSLSFSQNWINNYSKNENDRLVLLLTKTKSKSYFDLLQILLQKNTI